MPGATDDHQRPPAKPRAQEGQGGGAMGRRRPILLLLAELEPSGQRSAQKHPRRTPDGDRASETDSAVGLPLCQA